MTSQILSHKYDRLIQIMTRQIISHKYHRLNYHINEQSYTGAFYKYNNQNHGTKHSRRMKCSSTSWLERSGDPDIHTK